MARARDSKTYPVFYAELLESIGVNFVLAVQSMYAFTHHRSDRFDAGGERNREVRERVSVSAKDSKTTEGKKLTQYFFNLLSFFLSFFLFFFFFL